MIRRPLVAGNWKMNKTPSDTEAFIEEFLSTFQEPLSCDILLIPPFTSLDRAGRLLSGTPIALGAQDTHPEDAGAYTGAVSVGMLRACGCGHVLVGHSERRHVFGDSNEIVNRKLQNVLRHGLAAILCVGETLEQRQRGEMEDTLRSQLVGGLDTVPTEAMAGVIVAYEPVWAIGTGQTASPDQAQAAIALIRTMLGQRFDSNTAESIRILYGGSVKPSNAGELQTQPDIDGALVGGASLDPDSFHQIIRAVVGADSPC